LSIAACAAGFWQRYDIRQIEDLRNAVLGADLEIVQLAGPPVRGTMAFAARDGIIYSSGRIDGRVAIRGSVSRDAVTIGIGLRLGTGSRHWLNAVQDGDVGVFLPGADHDAIYAAGSLYIAATLTAERLEQEAASEGIALPATMLARTGLHRRPVAARDMAWLRSEFTHFHAARNVESRRWDNLGRACGGDQTHPAPHEQLAELCEVTSRRWLSFTTDRNLFSSGLRGKIRLHLSDPGPLFQRRE
jgi:hypothetical protein